MTLETDELKKHIKSAKEKLSDKVTPLSDVTGYNTAIYMITDLLACIIVGMAIGLFFQNVFDTSILLTAVLTLLGGIAGLWTVVRYAMSLEKRQEKFRQEHPEPYKPIPRVTEDDEHQ